MIHNLRVYRIDAYILLSMLAMFLFLMGAGSSSAQISKPGKLDNYQFRMLPSPLPEGDNMYSVIKEDFSFTLRDGVILDCSKFYPSEPNIFLPDGYPCVIMVHGYGDRKETLAHFAEAQAAYFYVVYTYSVRGQGVSGGLSNLISIIEAEDLIELVNFVKHDQSTGLDSSKIAIMGGSQGGTLPYMAASNGMKVAGIISALTSPEFASSWIENGSIKMTFLWTIEYTPDSVRYTPLVDRMSDWCYASGKKTNLWDSLAINVPKDRDFRDKVGNNTVPLLIENSWQDYFFNARQCISSFPLINSDNIVYLGAVMGHGGDISETENLWHMKFFNEWFYKYIWNWSNEFNIYKRFEFASTKYPRVGDNWSFQHSNSTTWPPENVTDNKLYFKKNKTIASTPENGNNDSHEFKNEVANNVTMQQLAWSEFSNTAMNGKFKVDSTLSYLSTPLTSNVMLVGTPKLFLDYQSDKNICQYNFHIYEVLPTGEQNLVTRISYTDRYYVKGQRRTKLIEGMSHSHIFSAGSRIRVAITNFERTKNDFKFLGTNPFVLPVLENSKNKVFLKNTYLELPLKNLTDNGVFANNHQTEEMNIGSSNSFRLNQNFPNPFNPVTNISFELPQGFAGDVTLKVYDITGKEVASLFNGILNEGSHNFTFGGDDKLSSGIYFYKLTAGNNTEIKRMTLIK